MNLKQAAAAAVIAAMAGTATADEPKFRQDQFETRTNGTIELSVERHSPIYAEFEKSEELTKRRSNRPPPSVSSASNTYLTSNR